MGFSSLHVCMESSDHWLQGTIHEESGGLDSSSPSGDMLTCSRPLIERRLRPPHDQAIIKCPRCDSTHTKFCYYNNYSLSQPRYFCKTCRRYWTKGGTLRNIPVGGGCRKNKKVSKKSNNNNDPSHNNNQNHQPLLLQPASGIATSYHPKDHLQLSFPDAAQFSHIGNLMGNPNFMLENNPRPIDFMDSKLEGIIGSTSSRNFHFLGNSDMGMGIGAGDINCHHHNGLTPNFHSLCSPSGFMGISSSFDGNNNNNSGTNYNIMDSSCQRLMLPYNEDPNDATIDVKPNPKLLSLEWQDQGCSDAGKESSSFGYLNGLGSWTGMINGYGSSTTTNPLV
ncbi:hypothetical protein K1719_030443 [Acacia pycnantha]|nr:hypothetical protein K1719_030443 [Acacia pycnantha]